MKNLKTRLTILLCVLSIMLLCFGLVACGTKTYKVTLDYNAEQGTVTLSPEAENNEYEEGTELTVTVTPNSDYELDTLTLSTEDRAATPNNEGKFVFKVQEDTTVRVTFKAKTPPPATDKFTLTVPASVANGSIEVSPESADNKYDDGTEITVTLKPAQGYEVDTFTVGGADKKADLQNNVYKFNITADTAINATFKATTPQPAEKFTLTVPASVANGTIEVSPESADGKYEKNAEITVTLKPAQSYEVDTFTVGGADKKADLQNNVYKFNITADTAVNATFKSSEPVVEKFTLTVPASVANGTIEVSPESADGKYEKNAEITVTLKPAQGYEVATFTVGGEDKKADLENNVYKFNITADTAITVSFSKIVEKFTLTVPASVANGTIEVSPESADNKYDEGTEITVTLTPEQGYEVDTFTVGGADKKADLQNNVYKFNITADTAVNATFKAKQFTVTTSCESAQGSITLSPEPTEGKYAYGTQVSVTVVATADYELDTFTVSTDKDARLDGEGKYTLTVSADTTISATFKVRKYSVKKNTPENGSIEVSPESADGKYEKNAEITVTLKPAENYVVETFTVGGVDKKADLQDNVYKFNITADTEINATFKLHDHVKDTEKGLQKGDTTHWYLCKVCGEKMEETAHAAAEGAEWKSDAAKNQHYKECVCGERVEVGDHNNEDDEYVSDGATGHHQVCTKCSLSFNQQAHDLDTEYTPVEEGHYQECMSCDYHTDVQPHVNPNPDGKCTAYHEHNDRYHGYDCQVCEFAVRIEHQPLMKYDYTQKEGEYKYCEGCDYRELVSTHKLNEFTPNNDGTHKAVCSNVACTYEEEENCKMQWTALVDAATGHSGVCSQCHYTVELESHDDLGAGGACSKCGYLAGHICADNADANGYYDGLCDSCGKIVDNIWEFQDGTITKYNGTYTKVKVPSSIEGSAVNTFSGDSGECFRGNITITDIIIPNSVTTLPSYGLSGCTSLTTVIILAQVNTLPLNFFMSSKSISCLVLPATLTSINNNAFGMSTSLATSALESVYYMGSAEQWTSIALGGTTAKILTSDKVLYYNDGESGSDTEWHWQVEGVIPQRGPWES